MQNQGQVVAAAAAPANVPIVPRWESANAATADACVGRGYNHVTRARLLNTSGTLSPLDRNSCIDALAAVVSA